MQVIRSKVLGFCFGVRRAVELAEQAISENKGKTVYSLGPLIHNEDFLEELKQKGLKILEQEKIDSVDENSVVVIRAHGVAPEIIKKLESKNCRIIDATCPRVKASQKMVERYTSRNDFVIISGDKNHGEMIGIAGYAGKNFLQIQNSQDAEKIDGTEFDKVNVILMSQTTYSETEFATIERVLKEKIKNLDVMNTICPATKERQDALKDLCSKVQGVLVIGGKSSANTKRLYQTSKENCKYAAHIQNSSEIESVFYTLETVGITAGASTPDKIIFEIEEALKNKTRL